MSDLIDEREIEELTERYGPFERRRYTLRMDEREFSYWQDKAACDRRGEVILAIQDADGGLILHSKDFYPAGTYRLPSGGVKWGESVLHALHREAQEEMGLEIEVERFLGVLEYELRCQGETMPFVSYVFLVRGDRGEPVPQDKEEHILSFCHVPVGELSAVVDNLRALKGDWRDWGEFRAIAHDFVVEMMGGIGDDDVTPEVR